MEIEMTQESGGCIEQKNADERTPAGVYPPPLRLAIVALTCSLSGFLSGLVGNFFLLVYSN
jgi:hypothetical protein